MPPPRSSGPLAPSAAAAPRSLPLGRSRKPYCLLAPAHFPRDRTERSLRTLLGAGSKFIEASRSIAPHVPAFVPAAIRFDEFKDGRWVEPIRESGLPIATVFAEHQDPLATPRQLEGQDSAPSPSVFVPSATNWMKLATVEQVAGNADLDEAFRCSCACCGPHGDIRHLASPRVAKETQDLHLMAACYRARALGDHFLFPPAGMARDLRKVGSRLRQFAPEWHFTDPKHWRRARVAHCTQLMHIAAWGRNQS